MELKDFYSEFTDQPIKDVFPVHNSGDSIPTPLDVNELAMGIKVELEHTNDPRTAVEIALDHIRETPDYYTRLSITGLAPEISSEQNPSSKSTPPMGGDNVSDTTVSPCCQDKETVTSVPFMENKSTTTYDQYKDIARRLIDQLTKMARIDRKKFSESQKNITPSVVKSVLIGLGNSDPTLSSTLTKIGSVAYKPKVVKEKL